MGFRFPMQNPAVYAHGYKLYENAKKNLKELNLKCSVEFFF